MSFEVEAIAKPFESRRIAAMPTGQRTKEHITLLLGTYGRSGTQAPLFLEEQLRSLKEQSHQNWSLFVSDDSPDTSMAEVVTAFAKKVPQSVQMSQGPGQGFSANYLKRLRDAPDGMLAFCDQDDLWYETKLARAAQALDGLNGPCLYCARVTFLRDGKRQEEHRAKRAPSFRNALIQNIARGNTIVLNAQAASLMKEVASRVGPVFAHDWLCYLIVAGAGGTIIYDDGAPVLDYRLHSGNQIGAAFGIGAALRRKQSVLNGNFRKQIDGNLAALRLCQDLLTADAKDTLNAFGHARKARISRLPKLMRLKLYRQRRLHTAGFLGASLIGRA